MALLLEERYRLKRGACRASYGPINSSAVFVRLNRPSFTRLKVYIIIRLPCVNIPRTSCTLGTGSPKNCTSERTEERRSETHKP